MILGIDPKIDYAFKRLFGREQNLALLIHLLDAVLKPSPDHQVADLQILNPFNDKDALDDKLSIVDIKARDRSGRQFHVEMQLLADRYFRKRVLYYWARLYQQQLHEGEEYVTLQPTISICFVDVLLYPKLPQYHSTFKLLDPKHALTFTEDLEIHLLELPKFTRPVEQLTDPLDVWLYFLRYADRLDPDALPAPLQVPVIQQAMKELKMLTQDDLERERYEARIKLQRDASSRVAAARIEGSLIGRIQMCQSLLKRPVTSEEELLAMSLEQLQRLVDQLQHELTR
jgi:predicted transposase/invertase (TIGR01784 family)